MFLVTFVLKSFILFDHTVNGIVFWFLFLTI